MKKILFTLFVLSSLSLFSQNEKKPIGGYVSGGISISGDTTSFGTRSYASIETGISYDNVSAGFVIGRSNLEEANFQNMFWEVKVSPSVWMSPVFGYAVLGYGAYMDYKRSFLEYGAGVSLPIKNMAYFAQVTNWDEINYVSVGLTYNFKYRK